MRRLARRCMHDQGGALAVTAALFMVALMGMAALAVDYGHMAMVQGELEKAAEAGALAGAQSLGSSSNPDWAQGLSTATYIVQQNRAAGQQLTDCDVTYGYWSLVSQTLQPFSITPQATDMPGVQVVVSKRPGQNGGPLQMIFGPIVGLSSYPLSGGAVAILKPVANWSILETGNGSVTLNNNVNINRDVGVAGDGPFTMGNNVVILGKAYLHTSTVKAIGNNSGVRGGVVQDATSNGILAGAKADAQTAYTQLTGLANNLGTVANQRTSRTFTGTATTNVLDVTNWQLNTGAVITLSGSASMKFVIRVSNYFTFGNNSRVNLTGGLKADNVTLVNRGTRTVTLNNNVILNVSLLSPSGAISIGNGSSVNGVIVGGQNITLNNNTVTTPPTTFIPSSGHGTALVH